MYIKLEYHCNGYAWLIVCDPNHVVGIGNWSICEGDLLDKSLLCIYKYIYSKTSLNRPNMGSTLSGPFREVVGLGS